MTEDFFSARRSDAREFPGVNTLVRHFLRHGDFDTIFVLGNFALGDMGGITDKQVKTIYLSFPLQDWHMNLSMYELRHAILVARSVPTASLISAPVQDLLSHCVNTILIDSLESDDHTLSVLTDSIRGFKTRRLFAGTCPSESGVLQRVSIWTNAPRPMLVPQGFRVAAIIAAHNEIDIIPHVLVHLQQQEIGVFFLDNWSTDGTFEFISEQFRSQLLGLERFPHDNPSPFFDLSQLLKRKEELVRSLDADWIIHQDADEFRYCPFHGLTLRHGLYLADQAGYNAVNHTVIEFPPTGNGTSTAGSPEDRLRYFRFGHQPTDLVQVKAWKNCGTPIHLAERGGHQVFFEGRKVYPYNFLLKHYPIRSQEQGLRKVFRERLPRYSPVNRERGWHVHYTRLTENHWFAESEDALELFEHNDFESRFLIQRITGCGIGPLHRHLEHRQLDTN